MNGARRTLSRRRLLKLGAVASLGALASPAYARAAAVVRHLDSAGVAPAATSGRVLYRQAAIADGRSSIRQTRMSVLVRDGRIAWIRPSDAEEDAGPASGLTIVNAAGLTIVPGMVDAHCHLTSPGGKDYLNRFLDAPRRLAEYAERNGELARAAGTAWLRDVGAPTVVDPVDGRRRALSLGIRDRWRQRPGRPRVVAAGTWIAAPRVLPKGLAIIVRSGDELLAAARRQLDQGADLVKLYVQADNSKDSPWTAAEIRRVVTMARQRGATVTAHATYVRTARTAVLGGVDAIEHGFRLDADTCAAMASRARTWSRRWSCRRPGSRSGARPAAPSGRRGPVDGTRGGCSPARLTAPASPARPGSGSVPAPTSAGAGLPPAGWPGRSSRSSRAG